MIDVDRNEVLTSIRLRRAIPEDRGALARMYAEFEPKGASLGLPPRRDAESWLARLATHHNFVLWFADRIIAHAVLCADGNTAEVAVFVHQDFRGCGLGKLLLNFLVEEAQRLGIRRVWGVTELDNVPMLRLAHSLGFAGGEDPGEFYLDLEKVASPPKPVKTAA